MRLWQVIHSWRQFMRTPLDKQWWKVAVERQLYAVLITKHSWLKDIRRTKILLSKLLFAFDDWKFLQINLCSIYFYTYLKAKYSGITLMCFFHIFIRLEFIQLAYALLKAPSFDTARVDFCFLKRKWCFDVISHLANPQLIEILNFN